MSVDFLAGESVDGLVVRALRLGGLAVRSVREESPGLPDREVLSLARRLNSVAITEDSDFGEWVFAHQEPSCGVVFLRYRHPERKQIPGVVVDLARRYGTDLYGKFSTVKRTGIRTREI